MSWKTGSRWIFVSATAGMLALSGAADAVAPAGSKAYVVNYESDSVSVVSIAPSGAASATSIAVGDGPQGAAISPEGDRVYVANSGDDTITVIDTATDAVIGAPIPVNGSSGLLGLVVSSPIGATVYAAGGDNVCVVSTASSIQTATIPIGAQVWNVVVHPTAPTIYVVAGSIVPVPTDTHAPGAPIPIAGGARAAALFAGGTRLFVVGSGAPVVIDTTSTPPAILQTLTDIGAQTDVAVGGRYAVVSNAYNTTLQEGSVDVYDLATTPPSLKHSIAAGGQVTGVEIAPDGSAAWARCRRFAGHGGQAGSPSEVLVQLDPAQPSPTLSRAALPAGGDGPGPVVGLFPGGIPSPDERVESYCSVATANVTLDANRPARSRLTVTGDYDAGHALPDLTDAATLDVGGLHLDIPSLERKGKSFKHAGLGFTFSLAPVSAASSRAKFTLTYRGDLAGKIAIDGPLAIRFSNDAADAAGEVRLSAGKFKLGKVPGSLAAPRLFVQSARAALKQGGQDTLSLVLGLAGDGAPPAEASDLTIGFGDVSITIPKARFKRKGSKDVFTGDVDGIRNATVDYLRGQVSIAGKSLELGDFSEGGNPVVVAVALGGASRSVAVRMALKGKTLQY